MSSLEIYDSSNSQLSSDEYSHDEDDDGLMDMAVSKQQSQPAKSANKSNDTSPTKTDSTASTTPRKLSEDLDAIAVARKPPASREHTQRQIKQMQRDNRANLYFKRRSIKWLNQRLNNKTDYMSQLKRALPKHQAQAKRMADYRAAKQAIEREQQERQLHQKQLQQQQRRERTPSRSRSRSRTGSLSPELICLDDDDTPEKPNDIPAVNLHQQQQQQKIDCKDTTAAVCLTAGNQIRSRGYSCSEPVIEAAAGCNNSEQQPPLQELQELVVPAAKAEVSLDMVVQEATLKRRRSPTPPTAVDPHAEKRTKSLTTVDLDDEIIELTPYAEPAKQPIPTPTPTPIATPLTLQQAMPAPPTTPQHKPVIRSNADPLNVFKVGSPYSLSPSSGMEYYVQKKVLCQQHLEQTQPENLAAVSLSLETPSPSIEPMNIAYPNQKQLDVPNIQTTTNVTWYALHSSAAGCAGTATASAGTAAASTGTAAASTVATTAATAATAVPAATAGATGSAATAPQQQQQQQQPPTSSPRTKQRDGESKQTQTNQATATSNNSPVDLDNSNSDAVFHQRIKDLYTELDDIMSDKVRAVKPELKSYGEEKMRIEADLKTLDNLIAQKEEEHNRLLHLRTVKEELLARIERKERILILKEILPSILNKNCSTSELYEMHTLLINEQNSPMPSRYGRNSMQQLIDRVENGLDEIKILRSVLAMQSKAPRVAEVPMPPPPPQHYETPSLHRRDSVPAMRSSLLANRTSTFARGTSMQENEQLQELSKRNKPPSRYQQLINESRQLTGSTADLAATSTYRQNESIDTLPRSQLDNNHIDELPLNPLYNSSPLAASQGRKNSNTNTQLNDLHSMHRAGMLQSLDSLDRAVNQTNRNTINNHSNRLSSSTNGPDLEAERRCQFCLRYKATYMCAACQNQWYCSRECQVRAWDTHWESCPN
ncbi:uncharacterized protein LOC6586636 [Drosophila mojavensis]|uniref:uncharacterized protein LOC6586636 n=1 Tax=Drosophila mojavensis TaxID=7230 RepID=UPI001CD0D0C6|nr:uncharacterized protein LOC6586636 [Drosophila mojavensis]